MDLKQLKLLVAVVEKGGYLGAGDFANLSHSAIHRQIKLLEQDIGEKVLERFGRSVQLTEAGQLLVDLASRVDGAVGATLTQIGELRSLKGGTLRIGTGTTTLVFFLPPVLTIFTERFPDVKLKMVTGTADQIIEGLQANHLDIGIVSEPVGKWTVERGIQYHRLYNEHFVFIASEDHPLASKSTINWQEFGSEPLICLSSGTRVRAAVDLLLAELPVSLNVSMELENEEAIVKMVELGFGVGIVSKRRLPLPGMKQLSLPVPGVDIGISAAVSCSYVPRRARVFLDICLDQIEGKPVGRATL